MESKTTMIIGAIVLFLAGFFIGQLTGGAYKKSGQPVQVVLADGKSLDVRLNEIYDAAAGAKKTLDDLTKGRQQQRRGPKEGEQYNFDLSNHVPRGNPEAKVTIVEFSDFQCPYCQRMANSLEEILKEYPNDVKLYFKHRPLNSIHPHAQGAAEAAFAAAAQGKFWQMHDVIFKNRAALDQASLEKYAAEIGLDMNKFKAAMQDHAYKDQVDKDAKEAEQYEINSTPTLFINGYYVQNPSPDVVKAQIEAALKK
ncbi:MAG: hypothetical protein A2V67_15160 [Deltaproteobacteria bacterium RBG_13_61_14]|nr:MAG: hypothetical protein A2V67_15160 [Deltaproteobacteria bacterium RBG_13_61_14]